MKITPQHYEHMKNEIVKNVNIVEYATWLRENGKYKDFMTRLAFDCLYHAGLTKWCCENLYEYVNDSHIKTALLKIINEISPETLKAA